MTSRSSGSDGADPRLEEARRLALRVLAFHARSEAQLRDRLTRAGHGAVAGEVLAWLRRLGYVDDDAYARGRARALLASGRSGPRLAERRLVAAGIPAADARRAIAEALAATGGAGAAAELALCSAALARRLGGGDPGSLDARERARHVRWLLGRGFSPEAVSRVLRAELE